MNALWGKFAQNEDRIEIFHVKAYEELIEFLDNPEYENVYFDFVDHNVIRVSCRKKNYQIPYSPGINIVIASLRLYQVLINPPLHSVLYYDTDSIIYCSTNRDELKNGLNVGQHIVEFCSTGPKC